MSVCVCVCVCVLGGGVVGVNDTMWSDVLRMQWKNKTLFQEECNNVRRSANGSEEGEVFRRLCYTVL